MVFSKHTTDRVLKRSLFAFLSCFLLGMYLWLSGGQGYRTCVLAGQISSGIFTILLAVEIWNSRMAILSKVIWTLALLCFQVLAVIAYFLVDRKEIQKRMQSNEQAIGE